MIKLLIIILACLNLFNVFLPKTMQFIRDTIYANEFLYAVNEWNKLNAVTILPSNSIYYDVRVTDYYDNDHSAPLAHTIINSNPLPAIIEFNTFYFSSMTYYERVKTAMHELGHTLGLEEFTDIDTPNNVMVQGLRSMIKLGPADIGAYRIRW